MITHRAFLSVFINPQRTIATQEICRQPDVPRRIFGSGYLRVTRTPLRFGSLECPGVHSRSLSAMPSTIELDVTAAHSAAPERTPATRQFPACQGWGRGFESLLPLQYLLDGSRGFSTAFCFSGAGLRWGVEAAGYLRVTGTFEARSYGHHEPFGFVANPPLF